MSKWKRLSNLGRGMLKVRSQASHGVSVSEGELNAELAVTKSELTRKRRTATTPSPQETPEATIEEEEPPEEEQEIVKTL